MTTPTLSVPVDGTNTHTSESVPLDGPPTPLEVDFCSRFAGYRVVERARRKRPVFTVDGARFAGEIVEWPTLGQFTIGMYDGARESDLASLHETLAEMRDGLFGRWPWTDGIARVGEHAGEPYRVVTASSPPRPSGGWILECEEPACTSFGQAHTAADDDLWYLHHAVDLADADQQWRVIVYRDSTELAWAIEVMSLDELLPDAAAAFAVALAAAADEARRLNTTQQVQA
jgi:hypothetical protein